MFSPYARPFSCESVCFFERKQTFSTLQHHMQFCILCKMAYALYFTHRHTRTTEFSVIAYNLYHTCFLGKIVTPSLPRNLPFYPAQTARDRSKKKIFEAFLISTCSKWNFFFPCKIKPLLQRLFPMPKPSRKTRAFLQNFLPFFRFACALIFYSMHALKNGFSTLCFHCAFSHRLDQSP